MLGTVPVSPMRLVTLVDQTSAVRVYNLDLSQQETILIPLTASVLLVVDLAHASTDRGLRTCLQLAPSIIFVLGRLGANLLQVLTISRQLASLELTVMSTAEPSGPVRLTALLHHAEADRSGGALTHPLWKNRRSCESVPICLPPVLLQ